MKIASTTRLNQKTGSALSGGDMKAISYGVTSAVRQSANASVASHLATWSEVRGSIMYQGFTVVPSAVTSMPRCLSSLMVSAMLSSPFFLRLSEALRS